MKYLGLIYLIFSSIALTLAMIGAWLGEFEKATVFILFAIYFEIAHERM